MFKYEVGQKFKSVGGWDAECVGVSDYGAGVFSHGNGAKIYHEAEDDGKSNISNGNPEYDLIIPKDEPMFKVGETYQDATDRNYLCVYVHDDGAANLMPVYTSGGKTVAYLWDADGKSVSLNSGYDIKPPVQWVTCEGHYDEGMGGIYGGDHDSPDCHNFTLTFPMIDGKPDWSQAKVVAA